MYDTPQTQTDGGQRPVDLLRGLASMYMSFDEAEKALSLLKLARWLERDNPSTDRLLAYAALAARDHQTGVAAVARLVARGSSVPEDLLQRSKLAQSILTDRATASSRG